MAGGSREYREWEEAADAMLGRLEEAQALNRADLDPIRERLMADLRDEGRRGADRLGTLRVGRARVLVPSTENIGQVNLTSERVRERFSAFRLHFLDKAAVREAFKNRETRRQLRGVPRDQFVHYSQRLAQHAREFLRQVAKLEPSLEEEVRETLAQVDDAENDLLKLEVRSFTNVRENLLRAVHGRMERTQAGKVIETVDLNRQLFNMSLLAHPEAVTRALLANASDKMAETVTGSTEQRPKVAWVVVGVGPNYQKKMTPSSRAARLVWRVFSQRDLDKTFESVNTRRTAATSWRGLGLDYQTQEWYVPVPPPLVDEAKEAMRARRAALMERLAREADERDKRGEKG